MTIPVSTVPAVQSYLLTAIRNAALTDSKPGDILVCFGQPATSAPPAIIEVSKEVRRTIDPASFVGSGGAGFLEESYDLDIVASVAEETVNTDGDPLALSQRAWQMIAYVETAVRSDPGLGTKADGTPLVQLAYPRETTGGEPVWAENGVGRECELTYILHIEALI